METPNKEGDKIPQEPTYKISSIFPKIAKLDGLLRCEDHRTYVLNPENWDQFITYWGARWYRLTGQQHTTQKYPAKHTVLLKSGEKFSACSQMVGVSISNEKESPVNALLRLYWRNLQSHWWGLQHIAYNVSEEENFWEVRTKLEAEGVKFMTPILAYTDTNGAFLKQMFVGSVVPYGPFIEIVQRGTGKNGEIFQDFNTNQIDALYSYYDEYSKTLIS